MFLYLFLFSFFFDLFGLLASATRVALSLIRVAIAVLPHSPRHALRILALGGIVRYRAWSFFVRTLLVDYWPKPYNANFVEGRRIRLGLAKAMVAFCSLHLIRYMSVRDIMLVLEQLHDASFFEDLVEHFFADATGCPDRFYGSDGQDYFREAAASLFFDALVANQELAKEFSETMGRAVGRKGLVFQFSVDHCYRTGYDKDLRPCWDAEGRELTASMQKGKRKSKGRKGRK